jgi:hypothetical protein
VKDIRGVFEAERPQADRVCPQQEGGSPSHAQSKRAAGVLTFHTEDTTENVTEAITESG